MILTFYKSSDDAPAVRYSLNTIHRSALAILVAVPNPTFHPDFLVGLLALEVLHHKALVAEAEAVAKKADAERS